MRLIALAITTVTPTPIILAHRSPWPSLRILLILMFVMTPQFRITTYFITAIKQAHRKQPGTRVPPAPACDQPLGQTPHPACPAGPLALTIVTCAHKVTE